MEEDAFWGLLWACEAAEGVAGTGRGFVSGWGDGGVPGEGLGGGRWGSRGGVSVR